MKSHLFFTRFYQFCRIMEELSCNPSALNLNPDSAIHDYRGLVGREVMNGRVRIQIQGCWITRLFFHYSTKLVKSCEEEVQFHV